MRAAASSITEGLTGVAGVSSAAGTAGVDDDAEGVPVGVVSESGRGAEAVPADVTASGTAETSATLDGVGVA